MAVLEIQLMVGEGSSAHGAGSGGYGKREMEENGREFCPRGGKCLLWEEGDGGVQAEVLPMEREVAVMGRGKW